MEQENKSNSKTKQKTEVKVRQKRKTSIKVKQPTKVRKIASKVDSKITDHFTCERSNITDLQEEVLAIEPSEQRSVLYFSHNIYFP